MRSFILFIALVALAGCVRNTRSQYADRSRTREVHRSTGPINDELRVEDDQLSLYEACLRRLGKTEKTQAYCLKELDRSQRVYVITRDGTVVSVD